MMTNEEAIITLTNILIDDYGCGLERRDYDSMRHAVKVMENAEKYRWHDLRKNPDDMPNDDGLYWIHVVWGSGKHAEGECDYSVEDGYFDTVWNAHVIAWKRVEPFEGESE